ncbi:putative plastid-lipid-associated protein 13, chloroplastic [Canna indica]|uniref:Plastid-lipid-associated protein 13, chloroplastic n=1 Tax=Canna indica TaxID=4628 RepID=A0AAQ3JSM6_9LILI|nr:putative plastid-lipid-associated protein 13, chloroplastic [Canna indica]
MAASMATVLGSVLPAVPSHRLPSLTPASPLEKSCRAPGLVLQHCRGGVGRWRAMVQEQTFQGPSAAYAREMERLSAKESLLLAFKDAGGFESLICGKTTEMQRIDVNERIVGLERLNPTTRPTTSPFLEGRWNFEWFSATSPASFAARFLFERSPSALANLLGMDMLLKDGCSNITANLRFFNSIESKFLLSTRLSLEGPARMKEEYVEGILETPTVSFDVVPEQLKAALGQVTGAVQQLPAPIRDAFDNGLKIPLSGTFERMFMISYLDEEILIIRDSAGTPDVLTRLEGSLASTAADPVIPEYES